MLLNNQTLNYLGLAMKAGKVKTGESVIDSIRKKKAYLVIICNDASEASKKTIIDKCSYYSVEYVLVDDSDLLSKAIGKSNRKAVSIMDKGFAIGIKKKLGQVM